MTNIALNTVRLLFKRKKLTQRILSEKRKKWQRTHNIKKMYLKFKFVSINTENITWKIFYFFHCDKQTCALCEEVLTICI